MRTIGAWLGLIGILAMLLVGAIIFGAIMLPLVALPDFLERQRHVWALRNARRLPEPDKSWWAAQHRGKAPAE